MRYSVERICQGLKLRALLRLYRLVAGAARAFTAFSTDRRDALAILKNLPRRRALRELRVTRELFPLFFSLISNESPNLLARLLFTAMPREEGGGERARERQRRRERERKSNFFRESKDEE